MTTAERVRAVIAREFAANSGLDEAQLERAVQRNTTSLEQLGADSLDGLELLIAIETEFGISIEIDADEWVTVGDVVQTVTAAVG